MPVVPSPWVISHVRDVFEIFEASDPPYSDLERACYERLVTDSRMKSVYENQYLNCRLSAEGWRLWFATATSVLPVDLISARERLENHVELVQKLAFHLEEAARLKRELEELSAGEASQPREMRDPLALIHEAVAHVKKDCQDSYLPSLFASYIKPTLDKLQSFRAGRYIPTVGQILTALSSTVSDYRDELGTSGPYSVEPEIAATMVNRQRTPLPAYVRCFDEAMRMRGDATCGDDFLVPAGIMAVQAAVALNLQVVEAKQIRSARKVP